MYIQARFCDRFDKNWQPCGKEIVITPEMYPVVPQTSKTEYLQEKLMAKSYPEYVFMHNTNISLPQFTKTHLNNL